MRTVGPPSVLFAALLLIASSTLAGTSTDSEQSPYPTGWRIRFYAASIDFNASSGYRSQPSRAQELDVGFGLGLNAEYRLSRRLGLDLGVLGGAAIDVAWNAIDNESWSWTVRDTLTFTPLTAGIDVHLIPDNRVDLVFCPMLTWTHYGGIVVYADTSWASTEIHFQENVGLALALRLGVPLGEHTRWSFAADLTHFESDLQSDIWLGERLQNDYEATVFGVGFGYGF
jgi:hypothetical protein